MSRIPGSPAPPVVAGAHHDVARQQNADAAVDIERLVGQVRIAGPENVVGLHLQAPLLPQRGLHVDLGEYAEALLDQHLAGPRHRLGIGQVNRDAALVVQRRPAGSPARAAGPGSAPGAAAASDA
ncbi:hypothetical protein PA7_19850 [Pseudonocardia asaccharolytica DSM 44247 = NBRC 16224]|uniref:Uncharacterized protein n=1 Tax=Pseudonocardia asaccharolytica DSM 44247 = NBRC 16224 TaxID=1123024 RepID=A0A511D5D7_9PSEU|nr:hypothetical protein PA7_19850 [Pseudonocardia asaccharolytica DSM 44247 = NBRC 16224]